MTRYYPIMLRLEGEQCLVVGGGPVAERRTRGLLDAGAAVRVVAPAATEGLERLASEGYITWVRREYRDEDLDGVRLCFAAADREVNHRVAEEAMRRGILVNAADDREAGSFAAPAVVRRGRLVLAVTASGASPALAGRIARELAERYGESWADYAEWLHRLRDAARAAVPDARERRRVLRAALDVPEAEWRRDLADGNLAARIRELMERPVSPAAEDGMDGTDGE
ncbi:MAG: siroheme synthase [Paenibacillaceae bacterium]|nr:MAG: siroheme synthase [Paenibacillaceae bacterium]